MQGRFLRRSPLFLFNFYVPLKDFYLPLKISQYRFCFLGPNYYFSHFWELIKVYYISTVNFN